MSTSLQPISSVAPLRGAEVDGVSGARWQPQMTEMPACDAAACALFESLMQQPLPFSAPAFDAGDEEA